MFKHKWNMNHIHEGKIYKCINGVVELPVRVEKLNPFDEIKSVSIDDNESLITEANKLGLGSPSTLKRLSEETLKERIEKARKEGE